jgi:hypothetical protein
LVDMYIRCVAEFAFYEQIFIGALDHGDLELAQRHLALLVAQFPDSSRVQRLEGMLAESRGAREGPRDL